MFDVPHLRRVMAVSGIVLALQPAARSQVPAPAGRDRPSEAPPGAVKAPGDHAMRHPLDPLEPPEIELAVAAVRKERRLTESVRFVSVSLKEPPKDVVRRRRPADGSPREAFLILLD